MAKLALFRNLGVEGGFTPGDLGSEGSTVTRGVTWESITESSISSDMIGEVALDMEPSGELYNRNADRVIIGFDTIELVKDWKCYKRN